MKFDKYRSSRLFMTMTPFHMCDEKFERASVAAQ